MNFNNFYKGRLRIYIMDLMNNFYIMDLMNNFHIMDLMNNFNNFYKGRLRIYIMDLFYRSECKYQKSYFVDRFCRTTISLLRLSNFIRKVMFRTIITNGKQNFWAWMPQSIAKFL